MIINYLNNILTYNNLIKSLKINDFIYKLFNLNNILIIQVNIISIVIILLLIKYK